MICSQQNMAVVYLKQLHKAPALSTVQRSASSLCEPVVVPKEIIRELSRSITATVPETTPVGSRSGGRPRNFSPVSWMARRLRKPQPHASRRAAEDIEDSDFEGSSRGWHDPWRHPTPHTETDST